jgi:transposase-like protein
MSESKSREFSPEYRVEIARRILNGESVSKIHHEIQVKRSVLYRWRDAYRKEGAAGLQKQRGRPRGTPDPTPRPRASEEERLREQVARLERKVGQQALQLDFFKGAFKRVEQARRNRGPGATASTPRSGR